jgi:hypothetical protein
MADNDAGFVDPADMLNELCEDEKAIVVRMPIGEESVNGLQ